MNDNISWSDRHKLTQALINADQAELEAIIGNITSATIGILDERIAEAYEDSLPEDIEDPLRVQLARDGQLEGLMGDVIEEIERRIHWLGDLYPFRLNNGSLEYQRSATGVYEYCLAISTAPSITKNPYPDLIRYFEILSADSFRAFLGDGADFLRTGAPPFTHAKSSACFKSGIDTINQKTGEWIWGPQPEALPDLPSVKDEGLDFVVWKRLDERSGSLFIVGQCACGKTDWHQKDQDIDSRYIRIVRWLSRFTLVPPVRAFSVPFPITASYILTTLSERAGLVMDRLRLTRIAESTPHRDHFVASHSEKIREYISLVTETESTASTT